MLNLQSTVIVLDSALVLLEARVSIATVAIGIGNLGVKLQGAVIVLDGALVLVEVEVSIAPVAVGIGILGVKLQSTVIVLDGSLNITTLGLAKPAHAVNPISLEL